MKYINKILVVTLSILFLAALAAGVGFIFSVRNVNVSYVYYGEDSNEDAYTSTKEKLNSLKGCGMLFVDESDVTEKIADSGLITVEKFEKVFPCTINIYLKERVKTFYKQTESGYVVYDECGKVISVETASDSVPLGDDNCPLVKFGTLTGVIEEEVASVCSLFSDVFTSLVRQVESVSVNGSLVLKMRSGLSIRFYLPEETGIAGIDTDMMQKAYACFNALSDAEKLKGEIAVLSSGYSATYIGSSLGGK